MTNNDLYLNFIMVLVHRNVKIAKDVPAWEVIEAVEETCKYDRFM